MALTEDQIQEIQEVLQEIASLPAEEQKTKGPELLKKLSTEQIEFLKQQQSTGMQCVFCKIAKGDIPAKTVYEDDNFMAFLDINPANPGHTLLISKEHIQILPQLSDELAASALNLIKRLAGAIFEATNAQGINILQNNGTIAGQAVPHIHFHIIPRFEDDKVKLEWDPLKLSEEQFKEVQKRILEKTKDIGKKVYDISGKVVEEKKKDESKKSAGELPKVRRRRA